MKALGKNENTLTYPGWTSILTQQSPGLARSRLRNQGNITLVHNSGSACIYLFQNRGVQSCLIDLFAPQHLASAATFRLQDTEAARTEYE